MTAAMLAAPVGLAFWPTPGPLLPLPPDRPGPAGPGKRADRPDPGGKGGAAADDVSRGSGGQDLPHRARLQPGWRQDTPGRWPHSGRPVPHQPPQRGKRLSPVAGARLSATRRHPRGAGGGLDPGGDIFLHGQPNALPDGITLHNDWTAGCMALADGDIEKLWRVVPLGTTFEFRP